MFRHETEFEPEPTGARSNKHTFLAQQHRIRDNGSLPIAEKFVSQLARFGLSFPPESCRRSRRRGTLRRNGVEVKRGEDYSGTAFSGPVTSHGSSRMAPSCILLLSTTVKINEFNSLKTKPSP